MDNYRFIVQDEHLKETMLTRFLDRGYDITIDKEYPEDQLNCFFIWSDGSKKCVFSKSTGGDNTFIVNKENIDSLLKKI